MLGLKRRGSNPEVGKGIIRGREVRVFHRSLVYKLREGVVPKDVEAVLRGSSDFKLAGESAFEEPSEHGIVRARMSEPVAAEAPARFAHDAGRLVHWAQSPAVMTPPALPRGAKWPTDGDCQVGDLGAWGLNESRFGVGWEVESCAGPQQYVMLAVVDGGIDVDASGLPENPELRIGDRLKLGKNFVGDGVWTDWTGHGTNTIGVLAALAGNPDATASSAHKNVAGINWGSSVYVYKVIDQYGDVDELHVKQAIDRAIKRGRNSLRHVVINVSLQGPPSAITDEIALNIQKARALLVAPSGNYTASSDTHIFSTGDSLNTVAALGSYSETNRKIVCVGAAQAPWTVCPFSRRGPAVSVVAPGFEILSTTRTAPWASHAHSGTSIAAPFVAGLASLIWQHAPDLVAWHVHKLIRATARSDGIQVFDGTSTPVDDTSAYGKGYIDAARALHLTAARSLGQLPLGF